MKKLLGIIVIILAVFLLSELFLVDLAENVISENLRTHYDIRELDVELRVSPAIGLLAGRIDAFHLNAAAMTPPDMVEVESLIVDFRDIRIDLVALLLHGELAFHRITNDQLHVVLTEDAVNSYFRETATGLDGFSFHFRPGEVLLNTRVRILDRRIGAGLAGQFVLVHGGSSKQRGPIEAKYVVERIHIEEIDLPRFIFKSFVEDIELYLKIDLLPLPLHIEGIRVEEGRLVVYGP